MNYTKRGSIWLKQQRDSSANFHLNQTSSTSLKQTSVKTRNIQKVNDNSFLNYKNLFPVQKEHDDKSSFKVFQVVDKKTNPENKGDWKHTKNVTKYSYLNKNNSTKKIHKSKDNLNSSKEYTFVISEINKKNNIRNNSNSNNLTRVQSNNSLIDRDQYKYVKKVINPFRPIDKFLNIKNENQVNRSQDYDVQSTDRTKLIENVRKSERNKSFIEKSLFNNKNISLKMNYDKYISNSKIKKKTVLDVSNSSSYLEIPYSVHKDKSNNEDLFTFNSPRMKKEESNEAQSNDFLNTCNQVYRSATSNNKRNKFLDENCLFCLSFSDNHNLTYSEQFERKLLNNSFKEAVKKKDFQRIKNSANSKLKNRTKSFSYGFSSYNQGRSNDVDTVEELHYVFVRFYQKNKYKYEVKDNIRNCGNSVILLNEQEIN